MQTTKFLDSPAPRRTTTTQAIIYTGMSLLTLSAFVPFALAAWHEAHPPAAVKTATGAPTAAPTTSTARETLTAEVQRQVQKWQTEKFGWNLTSSAPNLQDVLPVDMAAVEKSDVSRNRAGLIPGGAVPSLAGAYKRGRVCASDWPRPGSAAIEFLPTEASDPENPAQPWRVVLFYGTVNEATGFLRQAVADGRNADETIPLGTDSQAIAAVPVDKAEANGVTTFYCLCPVQSTLTVSGIKLMQRAEPTTTPEQEAHNRWQTLHDAFVSKARQRINAAATPQEKAQIGQEIDAWKAANPEPPRPTAAANDTQPSTRTAASRQAATADPNAIPPFQ